MKYSLYPGRFQPLHGGHKIQIQQLLDAGKNVCVAIRDTMKSDENPYDFWTRSGMVKSAFPNEWGGRVIALRIPDIEEIVYGRGVGFKVREVRLDKAVEDISATEIRNSLANRTKRSRKNNNVKVS